MPTDQDKTIRKLRAILSADVKGYSLLMANDEAFTIKTLKEYRKIMSDLIKQYSGRVVDSPGDNVLAEFSSVVDAVTCATDVQKVLKVKNEGLPDDKKLEFRIGVNIGDVVQDGDRIYGNGVNVAARIEGLAEPGGVSISRNAYDHIRDKLELGYEYLGEHSVKNIKHPVRVYKILMDPEDAGKLIGDVPKLVVKNWIWVTIVLAAVVIAVVGTMVYQNVTEPEFEPAKIEEMAYALPDKPSIAVLPFDNMSGNPEQEYFGDGITEDIITALSKIDDLFVIARNSTFTYKGKPVKIKQVAEELGVRYVLEGSVRRSEDRIRINAQLIDAVEGNHLWAERYDRSLKDIFTLQDEITMKIVTGLRIELTEGEQARMFGARSTNLDVQLKVMEGLSLWRKGTKEGLIRYGQIGKEIVDMAPEAPFGYIALTVYNWTLAMLGESPEESISKAFKNAKKALSLDESFALPHAILGNVYILMRKYEEAIAAGERAVELEPNGADVHVLLGSTLGYAGRLDEAIEHLNQGIRLNPFPPSWYFIQLGRCFRQKGMYEEALTAYEKAVQRSPEDIHNHISLAAVYAILDRNDEAEAAAKKVLEINPNFYIKIATKAWPYKNPADLKLFIDALRKAGLPYEPSIPLSDKPSIAVLPFDNLSDDPEQEYFSDGISVEIINGLVRWPSIVIIPKSSSFIYKGKTVDVQEVGREMGVRYVLEGSVRREGNRVRVTVQLVDVTTLKHLFSERYDREMKDIFAIQDEITMGVLTAMRVSLSGTGVPSHRGMPTKSIEAYLKLLQAEDIFLSMNRDAQARARQLAEDAIALDSEYSRAHALMAATIGNEVLLGVYNNSQEALQRAIELADKAIQLDDSENMAHRVRGFLALQNKDYDKAIAGARRAVELAPNSAIAQVILGYFLYSAGRTEEAIPILENAMALNPIPSPRALSHLGIAYRKARRYEEAVEVCKKLIQIQPNYIYPHLTLAATFVEIDKMDEAHTEIKEVLRINPNYSVKLIPRSFPWKEQNELDRLADSLSKAGLPD